MRKRLTHWWASALAGATVLALSAPLTATAEASITPPATAGSTADGPVAERVPPGTHTTTLITGDVVTTRQSAGAGSAGGTVEVTGPDGGPAEAHVTEAGGKLYVYPDAALPYVARGVLDRRLFDVTGLVAAGYDDARRDRLPLIVSYRSSPAGAWRSAPPAGATRTRDLSSLHGAALAQSRTGAADFWAAVTGASASRTAAGQAAGSFGQGIAHIWLDGKVTADLADTTAQIGAPKVWADGDTGQGVDVAVLDTGVDTEHPDLTDRIAATRSFVPDENVTDRNGHGTHVASTVAGTGAASGGKERGVAPGASLHIGKVLSDEGWGQDSWIIAGMEWAARDQHAKVVNMSLGSSEPSDGTDPESEAVNRLSAETGTLFVTAAGNTGTPASIGGPGAADAALTVGAVDSTDSVAYFSSQGPRVGDGALKPEITAPGVDVLAARSQYAPEGSGSYQTLSGTSMAAPHVTGAAALLARTHPDLTGSQLKDLLTSTSVLTPQYDAFQAGSGRLDVAAASTASVFASATAYAGQAPQGGSGSVVRRPVTYTNASAAPVTLTLSVAAPNAPAGLFGLSADQVVVPAHGTAAVTVTIDATRAPGNGRYSGQILATGPTGTPLAHTAVSLGDVAHKLKLVLKDAHGNPMPGVVQVLKSGEYDPMFVVVDESGTAEMFLQNDVYSVLAFKDVQGLHGPHSLGMALLGDPEVTLDHDTTVTLDAARIRRIDMTTPQRTETTYQRLEYNRSMGGAFWRDFMETQTSYDSLWAQPTTERVRHGDFHMAARWRKEEPALSVATATTDFTDVLRQAAVTPLPEGRRTLRTVVAGNGSAADYTGLDVRGKAVVVRRTAEVGDVEQAQAAAAAGARLLLVVNDQPGRQIREYGSDPFTPAALDVALLSTDEGERLIGQVRQGRNALTVTSVPASPYVYDLMQTWHNEIPADLVVKGGPRNLARVDVSFDSPDPTRGGGEYRFDWPSYSNWGIGTTMREPVNSRRVDWVSTTGDNRWGQEAYVDNLLYEIEPKRSYQAGSRQTQEWFKPIARPYLNDNYKAPSRSGDRLSADVPGWGGGDHVGMSMDYERTRQNLTLSQGATVLGQSSTGTVVAGDAPSAGALPYRLVVENSRDATVSRYSPSTRTEWTFTSKAPAPDTQAVLPLLQLDYAVPTDGADRASRQAGLAVTALHLPGATGAGRVDRLTVDVSYDDGHRWQRLRERNDGGHYALDAPRGAGFVSLRVSAGDTAGNTVTQTVSRAFGLR
ncbi:S8 family serine peptidase [Streptomyces sp. NPDC006012]|uniref:S8 family serine peptidase n=1 Tax=Streptomyces sp. NPDC006012 TaxID=3364739 RepID=UPI0036A0C267